MHKIKPLQKTIKLGEEDGLAALKHEQKSAGKTQHNFDFTLGNYHFSLSISRNLTIDRPLRKTTS